MAARGLLGGSLSALLVVRIALYVFALAAFALTSQAIGPAAAQELPRSAEPERLEQQFQRPVAPKRFIEPEIPEAERPLPTDEARKIRFVLAGVVADGATVYDEADLAPLYEPYLAKEISLADVYEIAAALTAKYRQDGYVLSRALVPAQKVEFGIVRIKVIEGFVDKVIIRGDVRGPHSLIRGMAEKITEDRPARLDVIQRYVMLINDLPGLLARTALQPSGRAPEAYDLVLTFEHDPIDGFASVDNRGSDFVGPYQLFLGASLNSVLGLYELTRLQLATTPAEPRELGYVELFHQENIGLEGTRVAIAGSRTVSEPGSTLEDEDVESRSTHAELTLTHPFIRNRERSLIASGIFSFRNSSADARDIEIRDDRLRVIRLNLTYGFRDGWRGQNRIDVTASQGLNIFNASTPGSRNLSRSDGESDFTKFTLGLLRLQDLGNSWSVLLTAKAQKAIDPLLSAEEITIGGTAFGRAFDPAEIGGDDGGAVKGELRFTRTPGLQLLQQYQLYAYVDAGAVWNFDLNGGGKVRDSLASAGIGVRFTFTDWLSLYLEGDKPFLRAAGANDEGGRDMRFFFGLTAIF